MALELIALGVGFSAHSHAQNAGTGHTPAYRSSIRIQDQDDRERSEAARLAALARIDAAQAMTSALAHVHGKVLRVALGNENGHLVYSVEIKTSNNQVRDVKVDAGNGAVLHIDADVEERTED
jgi:uncharacterized membrane protein YkoI